MNYYLISDSKTISEDIALLKMKCIQSFNEDGILIVDVKMRLFVDQGMDSIECEIV